MRIPLALLLFSLALLAQDPAPTWRWESPSGQLQAVARFVEADLPREIVLFDKRNPGQKVNLCTFERDADLHFSPDDQWIAMDDELGSGQTEIRLFKRVSGLNYQETSQRPGAAAWDLLASTHKVPYPATLSHAYAHVLRWSSNSRAFLMALQGHEDQYQCVEQWLCVYEVQTSKVSLSLNRMNAGSVVFKRRRKAFAK